MRYEKIAEGFVCRNDRDTDGLICVGPRSALTRSGELLCTFALQSGLGINDFVPVLCRSSDGGRFWTYTGPIWPQLVETHSIGGSISGLRTGDLYYLGMRTPIDEPGEPFWSDETQGMKQNDLFWSRSTDDGHWLVPAADHSIARGVHGGGTRRPVHHPRRSLPRALRAIQQLRRHA